MGIGRPFLYAFSAYGQEGVERALQILHVSEVVRDCDSSMLMTFDRTNLR